MLWGSSYYLRSQAGHLYLNGSCAHTTHSVLLLISITFRCEVVEINIVKFTEHNNCWVLQYHIKSLCKLAKITLSQHNELWTHCFLTLFTVMSHTSLKPILSNFFHHKKLISYEQELIVNHSFRDVNTAEIWKKFSVLKLTIKLTILQASHLNQNVSKS